MAPTRGQRKRASELPASENTRSVSTTSFQKVVRITRAPRRQQAQPAEGRRWWHLPERSYRKPLTITVKYRGGAEGWVEVHARGSKGFYPGDTPLLDVVLEVNSVR